MDKLLTIVVPSYNVEKYILNLMEKLIKVNRLNQIEIIIVNDGSTDKTLELSNKCANSFPDVIKVINKENGGHGSAINVGIQEANGKYFKLLDADDWLNINAVDNLLPQLVSETADLIVSPYYEFDDKKHTYKIYNPFSRLKEGFGYTYGDSFKSIPPMHAIIYRTDILKDNFDQIKVDENSFYVDVEYIIYPSVFVNKIKYYPNPIYIYRINEVGQSTSIKKLIQNKNQHNNVMHNINGYIQSVNTSVDDAKLNLMTNRLSEMIAAQFKIILSQKINLRTFHELTELFNDINGNFNYNVKKMNLPIQILILSKFTMFPLLHGLTMLKAKLIRQ